MFNLTVSEAHTYYVGVDGWLVHNQNGGSGSKGPYGGMTDGQLQKSAASYQSLIDEHLQKLADYKANPDAFDNKGILKNASPEMRQKIIDGRIKALEQQIAKQTGELDKIMSEIKRRWCGL